MLNQPNPFASFFALAEGKPGFVEDLSEFIDGIPLEEK